MENVDEIKKRHEGSLKTLWKIYQSDEPFYYNLYFLVSLGLTIILFLVSLFSNESTYTLIQSIANSTVSVLPNLLGFSLGAYILIVGFGGTEILNVITKPLKGQKNFSFYQKLNAVFGVTVLLEIIALLISFVLIYLDKSLPILHTVKFSFIYYVIVILNLLVLFIALFAVMYSLFMLINVIKQVFIFAQTIHFCVYISKIKEEKEQQAKNVKKDEVV